MEENYSISLSQLAEEFNLETVVVPENFDKILVQTPEVARPGLALAGFYEIFEEERLHPRSRAYPGPCPCSRTGPSRRNRRRTRS